MKELLEHGHWQVHRHSPALRAGHSPPRRRVRPVAQPTLGRRWIWLWPHRRRRLERESFERQVHARETTRPGGRLERGRRLGRVLWRRRGHARRRRAARRRRQTAARRVAPLRLSQRAVEEVRRVALLRRRRRQRRGAQPAEAGRVGTGPNHVAATAGATNTINRSRCSALFAALSDCSSRPVRRLYYNSSAHTQSGRCRRFGSAVY